MRKAVLLLAFASLHAGCFDDSEPQAPQCTSATVSSVRIGMDELSAGPTTVTTTTGGAFRVRVIAKAGSRALNARLQLHADPSGADGGVVRPVDGTIDDVLVALERGVDGTRVGEAVLAWPDDCRVRLTVTVLDCVKTHTLELARP